MALFIFLPARMGDIVGGLMATMTIDPGMGIAQITPPQVICPGPAPAFVAMIESSAAKAPQSAAPSTEPQSIARAPDGLFYIDAVVNGAPIRFLIDTGATTIVLTKDDAQRAGVMPAPVAFDSTANTAGGDVAMARVELARMNVGNAIDFNVPAVVTRGNLGVSLLGASWLTQIGSLTITGDRMTLQ